MFGMFDGKGKPGANCPPHDGARQMADRADTHRHCGPFPAISRGIAVRRYVRGHRLPPPAPIRRPRQECAAILAVVKRFIADTGIPRAFRSYNGADYMNPSFVEYCNGIRRKLTALYTPQQNGPVENALWRAFKAGLRHVWAFQIPTRTSAWTRSRALWTRQRQGCGLSHYFEPRSASIGRLPP